jgi:hypothetical protein
MFYQKPVRPSPTGLFFRPSKGDEMTVDTKEFADCNEVAELLRIKPNSVRTRLYRTGSLWGIEPMKAPNGRNLFPVAAVRGLIRDRKGVC